MLLFLFSFNMQFNYFLLLQGYSFVAPSVLFSRNVISDDIFDLFPERPDISKLLAAKFKVKLNVLNINMYRQFVTLRIYCRKNTP